LLLLLGGCAGACLTCPLTCSCCSCSLGTSCCCWPVCLAPCF
jgi:hypothetical protein